MGVTLTNLTIKWLANTILPGWFSAGLSMETSFNMLTRAGFKVTLPQVGNVFRSWERKQQQFERQKVVQPTGVPPIADLVESKWRSRAAYKITVDVDIFYPDIGEVWTERRTFFVRKWEDPSVMAAKFLKAMQEATYRYEESYYDARFVGAEHKEGAHY